MTSTTPWGGKKKTAKKKASKKARAKDVAEAAPATEPEQAEHAAERSAERAAEAEHSLVTMTRDGKTAQVAEPEVANWNSVGWTIAD